MKTKEFFTMLSKTLNFLLVITLFFLSTNGFGQQGNVWTFGAGAQIDFGPVSPVVSSSNISSYEGCASMSDDLGNLIFYTDGSQVWNGLGSSIGAGLNGHWSSAQSSIIVPEPGLTPNSNTGRYYIITVNQLGIGKPNYTIVDNTGISPVLGTINNTLPDDATAANITEGMTVAAHANCIDYWLIVHEVGNNNFKSYQITNAGIQSPIVTSIGPNNGGGINAASCMKVSPNSSKLAFCVRTSSVNLFDFDSSTGVVSNQITVDNTGSVYYGVEFSPNSNVFYYTDLLTGLYRYDIALGNLSTNMGAIIPGVTNIYGSLQLAPNGSIYMARDGDAVMANLNQTFLGEITNADNYATASFIANGLALAAGTGVKGGLPNIIPSLTLLPCSAVCDSLFTTVTIDITSDTYWEGKIYIPDNTIITVNNNAVLDITNTDVVFGECSGINFFVGAELRANNSVFRPCNVNSTWRGLLFNSGSEDNQINECTFKNAEVSLLFQGNTQAQINSNTFSNCNEGIYISNSQFTESIIGNNFIINNSFPIYYECTGLTSPDDVICIHSIGSNGNDNDNDIDFETVILQNSFTKSNQVYQNLSVTGIDMSIGNGIISENTMTNMSNGIVITSPSGNVSIENNEIETNSLENVSLSNTSQISTFNVTNSFIFINNNELVNSSTLENVTRNAIYLERSRNVSVQNNEIEGFNWGINADRCTRLNISENTITSGLDAGIFFDESNQAKSENFITCNDITMLYNRGASIITNETTRRTLIASNCLKDGNVGLRTATTSTSNSTNSIPVIRNNFIYNYTVGIDNIGHVGNIGATGDPGMNTLWSNRASLALDINSSTAISVADNYGLFFANWGMVSVAGNTPTHSTASCATQIIDYNNQGHLNSEYHCSNYDEFLSPIVNNSAHFIVPPNDEVQNYLSDENNNAYVTITKLIGNKAFSESEMSNLISVADLNASQVDEIWYDYYSKSGHYNKALEHLNTLDDENFKEIERIGLKRSFNIELDNDDLAILDKVIKSQDTEFLLFNKAVALSKTTGNHGRYKYNFIKYEPVLIDDIQIDNLKKDVITMTVFPNPTNGVVTLEILNGKVSSNENLLVYNVYGEIVHTEKLNFEAGQINLNLEELTAGTYFVVLTSESEITARCKLVIR